MLSPAVAFACWSFLTMPFRAVLAGFVAEFAALEAFSLSGVRFSGCALLTISL